jgi:hypothetical protein
MFVSLLIMKHLNDMKETNPGDLEKWFIKKEKDDPYHWKI